jgi:hypothetical protein
MVEGLSCLSQERKKEKKKKIESWGTREGTTCGNDLEPSISSTIERSDKKKQPCHKIIYGYWSMQEQMMINSIESFRKLPDEAESSPCPIIVDLMSSASSQVSSSTVTTFKPQKMV